MRRDQPLYVLADHIGLHLDAMTRAKRAERGGLEGEIN
jgi:hypothetical protein